MFRMTRQLTASSKLGILQNICKVQGFVASQNLSHSSDGIIHPDAPEEVPIPLPKERPGESVEQKKARLLYQSRKRGMLENGLLLSTFAKKYLSAMSVPELEMYDSLINKPSNDWDIYYWAIGQRDPPQEFNNKIMTMLQEHATNKDLELRNCQPDL